MQQIVTNSAQETEAFAAQFAKTLRGPVVVAFFGGLGMGKTAFTRGLAKGLGIAQEVSSPTFALVHEYHGDKHTLYHFDMYRVTDWDSLYSTGFYDYLTPDSILFVEWSENIDGALPENAIRVDISKGEAENARLITITGGDGRW